MSRIVCTCMALIVVLAVPASAQMSYADIESIQTSIEAVGATWIAGENDITRSSAEERSQLVSPSIPDRLSYHRSSLTVAPATIPPTSFSWGDFGLYYLTPPKNMGGCGAGTCTHPVIGALEARYRIMMDRLGFTPPMIDLSEQHLVSCYHGSCNGGYAGNFLDYIRENGVPDEDCFPYSATAEACLPCADWISRAYFISDWGQVYGPEAMMQEIYDNGPIVIRVDIYQDFYSYSSGVYQHVTGPLLGGTYVMFYGWGTDEYGSDFWLAKNQWGTTWGETGPGNTRGWFRIRKGTNESGCEEYVYSMVPVLLDSDDDGVPNSLDQCPGFNDHADSDQDFIADGCDNCPNDFNPGQEDLDLNGIGDVCEGCCIDRVGDANGLGGDEPTIGDVSVMIDAKFISGTCDGILDCLTEADINQSGGTDATCDDITIGDISTLIDYLFITGESLGLADCL